ncbi:MAG: MBL fold metallo-hydrolase [Cyanobacteria bacterium]|nr:MBL fold metallo-hydrolase [Cyanobacteriota bacterium]
MIARTLFAVAILIAASSAAAQPVPAAGADRAITAIGGNLYDVRDGKQHTVFLATSAGIVLVDPISLPTSRWLAEQFAERFPGVPVRYVILTHHHADRASGATLFPRSQVVAHDTFRRALSDSRKGRTDDYRAVPMPSTTFTKRHVIDVGGERIELIHAGPFHSSDTIVVSFATARTLFAADHPPLGAVPFSFGTAQAAPVVTWLQAIASATGVDTIVFGDGTRFTPDAIASLADYLGTLRAAVVSGYQRGRSLRKMQDTLQLPAHQRLPHYAARRDHIAAIHRGLHYRSVDLTLLGLANGLEEDSQDYCGSYDACSSGGVLPAGSAALTFSLKRWFAVQGEVMLSDQFYGARTRSSYAEELAFRPTRGALLLRLSTPNPGRLSIALLGGVSRTFGDLDGFDRVSGLLAPAGGRHPLTTGTMRGGVTAGVELSQRIGVARLVFPIRVTQISGALPAHWPSRYDAQAGAGISVPLWRSVE